jgi:catechol 2,3-dioxygenase-like lactoylglutathione lyase family enzyme
MQINMITRTVASLDKARAFYEEVLGFIPDASYAPTRWQSYRCEGTAFFAIGEEPGSTDEIGFVVDDVEALWNKVKDTAEVASPLEKTAWGTYRFVVRDPDGHLLAFGQR